MNLKYENVVESRFKKLPNVPQFIVELILVFRVPPGGLGAIMS